MRLDHITPDGLAAKAWGKGTTDKTVAGFQKSRAGAARPPRRTSLLGDHSEREPPDPIPNSEVKPLSADDSVALCHAKVGNRQALEKTAPAISTWRGLFFWLLI